MAGIGIELRKLTDNDSFWGFLRAHLYAGILSSGAWIISISILIAIYFYLNDRLGPVLFSIQFLVVITYLIAVSLILSGIFQHTLNRFIADRIFDKKLDLICPNFFTAILILTIPATLIGYVSIELLFANQSLLLKILLVCSFVELNLIWVFSNAFAGLKKYRFILFSFLISYAIIFLLAILLYSYQLPGLMLAFCIGHTLLLLAFFVFLLHNYPSKKFLGWEIIQFLKKYQSLAYGGFLFYLGVWIDKFCFWINPNTSLPILDSLRASPVYDMPIFIAFLLMIPGMSMFFYEIETNFSRYYHRYYDAIRDGATLQEIHEKHIEVVAMARTCIFNTLKVQAFTAAFTIILAPEILNLLKLSPVFVYLLRIDIIASSLLILFIGQLNLLYYLNMPKKAAYMALLFFLLNFLFTFCSFYLGPLYYGYGFASALLVCNVVSFVLLIKSFEKLTYYSFMSVNN
ncbi:exopolysaccharide Pel transporter PelG [Legionella spiritensis]|uniref:Transmembrane protein n=1 Tax=Legionella spiritensis TaxID=452 RepID=A0A0W0YXS2_LEGSP|nr:exopolysaccharide Pel transporter PelG [Legionella spiritensis]KTD61684.1 hypothetical protein Lspi_2314 [Legionella spiritensis]SNV38954.1 Predicted membrane protein [Legionella spiritensis]